MAKTLLLSKDWDLQLDKAGRIATTAGLYGVAQNVANAVRLFTADAFFAQEDGVPHFAVDVSQKPNQALITAMVGDAASAVPEVARAVPTLTKFQNRVLEGNIAITTTLGETVNVAF